MARSDRPYEYDWTFLVALGLTLVLVAALLLYAGLTA